ncbi:MAG: ATP-dependent DNA helicase, partial [Candidatus Methanoperedenaceae archaeon]|nr:ATP-dependent DNA helicase [Candidatus Methanoperedenaceae archaeon]
RKQVVLFEGACGTGKTLSSLAPAIHIAKQEKKTVVIATNVHQQMAQFIEEAREIQKKNNIKVIVLKGKMLMCPKPNMDYDTCSLLRDNTYKLMEQEKDVAHLKNEMKSVKDKQKRVKEPGLIELQRELSRESDKYERQLHELKKNSCDMLLEILKTDSINFCTWLFSDVRTPEEVADWALSNNSCGYELLKRYMKEADLLICNYHHFLDEDIRANVLGWMEKGIDDIILICDETHNLESSARSHSSRTLSERDIGKALDECNSKIEVIPGEGVEQFLNVLLDTLISTYNQKLDKNFGEREKVGENWYDLQIADPEEREDMFKNKLLSMLNKAGINKHVDIIEKMRSLGLKIDTSYEKQFNEGKIQVRKVSYVLKTAIFLSDYMKLSNDPNYYPILSVRRLNNEIYGRLELFICIPKIVTAPLINSVNAAVLMSATITPFENVIRTLGITRETCECAYELTFPKERRLTLAVSVPPLFAKERGSPQTKERITNLLNEIVEQTDGNVLIFFPSFSEASQYKNLIICDAPIFLDEIGVSSQSIRDKFFRIGEEGKKAVLMSYIWGTLTEGVDYKDGRCRTVVIVGVGFPALNDRMRAIESAYEAEYGHGWDYAIVTPTIMKVRQAMGRVVRSPTDYGARILIDERYSTHTICEINWNEIPGKCDEKFLDFLKQNNYLKLERPGKINKLSLNVLQIFDGKDIYFFKLNEKKTKALLESKGKKMQEFAVDEVNTTLMISRWDSVLKFFPKGEREEFVDIKPDRVKFSLRNFFNDIKKMDLKNNNYNDADTTIKLKSLK